MIISKIRKVGAARYLKTSKLNRRINMLKRRFKGVGSYPRVKGVVGSKQLRYSEAIDEAIEAYVGDRSDSDKAALRSDIIRCAYENDTTPAEFFIFGFEKLSKSERKAFVSRNEKDTVMMHNVSMADYKLLHDKYSFFKRFREYFKRDVCLLDSSASNDDFIEFCRKHREYIAKLESGKMGVGTTIRKHDGSEEAIRGEIEFLSSSGDKWIIEELIQQDPRMGALHPESVNTIRICSRFENGHAVVFESFVRMGQGGSSVDNICSGGLTAQVDGKTGIVIGDAFDRMCNFYKDHPSTGVIVKGFAIPDWDGLLKMLDQIQSKIPDYPYVGWDFAFSDKGWVIVEGNWGNFITQYLKRGIRAEFEKCFKKH